MFDRYDEHARRSIFFARYEASVFGSAWIGTEHLLLGILREDWILRNELPVGATTQIRTEFERRCPGPYQDVPTSGDLPLSKECKRALAYGSEEAETLQHEMITAGHLVLGLLRVEECMAANILLQFGIDSGRYRSVVQKHVLGATGRPSVSAEPTEERVAVVAPSLESAVNTLQKLVGRTANGLGRYLEPYSEQRLKRRPWTRKEALGHLIDWAATHQQWFARALTESKLVAAGYPQEDWISNNTRTSPGRTLRIYGSR
jgi:ATP-dependent Clp protease ATP-binding subunit ClpA